MPDDCIAVALGLPQLKILRRAGRKRWGGDCGDDSEQLHVLLNTNNQAQAVTNGRRLRELLAVDK